MITNANELVWYETFRIFLGSYGSIGGSDVDEAVEAANKAADAFDQRFLKPKGDGQVKTMDSTETI